MTDVDVGFNMGQMKTGYPLLIQALDQVQSGL